MIKKLILTLAVVAVSIGAFAQAIPSATPKNNADLHFNTIPFGSLNHNSLTNTGTFTNAIAPITPNKAGDFWVIITNCPDRGAMTFHLDTSTDNGTTYTATGLATNGLIQLTCNFNANTSGTNFLFKTNFAATVVQGVSHVKLSRAAGTAATNVYTYRVGITQPAPFPY